MTNPVETLNHIHNLLKSDGSLLIEVPRFNSFYSRLFKTNWFHLDAPRHLFHFSDMSIEKILNMTGFSIYKTIKYDLMYDSFGAIQSFLNIFCKRFNLLNELNTKKLSISSLFSKKDYRSVLDAFLSLFFQYATFFPMLILTSILSKLNIGGTLIVFSKKSIT